MEIGKSRDFSNLSKNCFERRKYVAVATYNDKNSQNFFYVALGPNAGYDIIHKISGSHTTTRQSL